MALAELFIVVVCRLRHVGKSPFKRIFPPSRAWFPRPRKELFIASGKLELRGTDPGAGVLRIRKLHQAVS